MDAGVEHRRREKNLSSCSLRLEDSSGWSLLQKEILSKKKKSGEATALVWIWIQAKLNARGEQGQLLWQVTWNGGTVLSPMLSWNLTWYGWCDQMNVSSTWLQLLWKYQAPVSGGECRILLLIITDYYISRASHWKPAWKDIDPRGARARTWIPKHPSKGCTMVSAGSFWSTSKPWLLFFSAKNH